MTIGEKMVWATVYAQTLAAAQSNSRRPSAQMRVAITEACYAVEFLREMDMLDPPLTPERRALAEEMLK